MHSKKIKTGPTVDAHDPAWLARYLSGSLGWDTPCIEALVEALDPYYRYIGRARHIYETVTLPLIENLGLEVHPLIAKRKLMSRKVLPVEWSGPGAAGLGSIRALGGTDFSEWCKGVPMGPGSTALNADTPMNPQSRNLWTNIISERLGRLKLYQDFHSLASNRKNFVRRHEAVYSKDLSDAMSQGLFLTITIGNTPFILMELDLHNTEESIITATSIRLIPEFTGTEVTKLKSHISTHSEAAVIPACALEVISRASHWHGDDLFQLIEATLDGLEKFASQLLQFRLGGGTDKSVFEG